MALDDARNRLYDTCQASGTIDVLDTAALVAGTAAQKANDNLPLPTDHTEPTLELAPMTGGFGNKVCGGVTTNSENEQNTLYAKAVTFFPNPNLNADGSLSTALPLPGGRTGDAIRGAQLFGELGCQSCHPAPLFTLDQFRVFLPVGFSIQPTRMREVNTPVLIPLREKCQDANRPTGTDGSTGFGVPTLRGIWDTFPLLLSGAAGFEAVGSEPVFNEPCMAGSDGCCTQLEGPINPDGIPVPEQHLELTSKDALRQMLPPPLAVAGSGHGTAIGLSSSELDALIAYLRSF
jgi:hypothetical protein